MTLEIVLFAAFRIATSLPVLRWPLAGGLLAIGGDLADLLLRDLVDLGGLGDYQLLDKALDQVYLALFLIVALRWEGAERRVAVGLYLYRLAGLLLFVMTGERAVLLLFPNVFEFWFILVAAIHHLPRPMTWTPGRVAAILAVLTVLKLVQEWALHVGQVFESMTSIQFLEELWRRLTGGG
ncbi:MAG: hypothetical protein V2B17_08325 [Chloroflexota bacterium]